MPREPRPTSDEPLVEEAAKALRERAERAVRSGPVEGRLQQMLTLTANPSTGGATLTLQRLQTNRGVVYRASFNPEEGHMEALTADEAIVQLAAQLTLGMEREIQKLHDTADGLQVHVDTLLGKKEEAPE